MKTAREVPGDAAAEGGDPPGLHPVRRADRAQRRVLVRFGPEVQEVSRGLIARSASILVRVTVIAGLAAALVACVRRGSGSGSRATRDEERPADAIVVLGAAQYDGRPSPVFEARLEHAVALYRAGVAPRFVVTGGKRAGDRTTEAAVARDYAIAHGVPAAAIFGEDEAHNTLDSLRAVAGELDRARAAVAPCSSPTRPTCTASCGSRPTSGWRRTGRRRVHRPWMRISSGGCAPRRTSWARSSSTS